MGKEPTPLEKVTKDADILRKQVDKIVKESLKNANNKKLKDRELKVKANFKSCYDLQPQVTELLQRAEELSEENEPKPKNFENKKKKEVDRIRTWQTQLDDAMSKLLPNEEGDNYRKELKKEAGEGEMEEEKGTKEEGEEGGDTLEDTAKEGEGEDEEGEEDEEEVEEEEEEVEEEEVEEEEEEEDEEEDEEEEEEEEGVEEEKTMPKQIEEAKASPKKAEKKPQKVEEEEEEEEEEEDEEDEDDEEDDEEESGEEEEEEEEEVEGEGKEETDMEVTTTGRLFEALYDFEGQEKGDLSFKKGDILTIINTREDGWWEAENDKGDKGNVPSTYLQMHNKYKDLQQDDQSEEEEDEEEEEEEEEGEESPRGKKKVKKQKSGRELWTGIRKAVTETSVTDVLHAMGAVPSGFRISTLGQKFNTDNNYTMKNYLVPKLSASNLSYKDLFFDPSANKIKGRLSRDQRMVTLTSCRQIPVPAGGLEVTSRHVRICLFDGQNILSNIHTVKVATVDREQRTWSFNTKISDLMDTYQHAEVFYRTNSIGSSVGILFELCASYYRESTKERGEFSCGWAHLPLEDSITGLPIQNKTYDLYVNGGTIYEKGVEVDPSISRRTSTNALMSLISGNKQPRLIVKLSVPKREQKELMDTLPETLIGNTSLLQMYSYYRQILADTLLRDRLDLESTEVIHSPVLATFPKIADQHDLMKLLRDTWIETVRGIRRAEMRDEEYMKDTFKKVVMESVYPLFYSASLREYKSGAALIEQSRQEEIDKFRQQKLSKRGILALLLSSDMTHLPIDMQEVSFNVINPYCLAQPTNTQVAVQS